MRGLGRVREEKESSVEVSVRHDLGSIARHNYILWVYGLIGAEVVHDGNSFFECYGTEVLHS